MTHHFTVLSESSLIRTVGHGNRKGVTLRRARPSRRLVCPVAQELSVARESPPAGPFGGGRPTGCASGSSLEPLYY